MLGTTHKIPRGFTMWRDEAPPSARQVYKYYLKHDATGVRVYGYLEHFDSYNHMVKGLYEMLMQKLDQEI